jgi:hypothetical protein
LLSESPPIFSELSLNIHAHITTHGQVHTVVDDENMRLRRFTRWELGRHDLEVSKRRWLVVNPRNGWMNTVSKVMTIESLFVSTWGFIHILLSSGRFNRKK